MKRLLGVLATAIAILGLGGLPAQAIPAYDPIDIEVDEQECGATTFTATWPDGAVLVTGAALVVQVGDDHSVEPLPGEEGAEATVTVGPFTTDTTIKYRAWGGQERDYDNPPLTPEGLLELVDWLDADDTRTPTDADAPGVEWHELDVEGCPVEVTPEEPTLTQATCDGPAVLTVPETEGVVYSHESGPVEAGEITVTAEPAEGYEFPEGAETEWTFTVEEAPTAEECDPSDDPTDEPTPDPTDEPTDEPTEDPTDEPTDEPTEDPTDEPSDDDDEELPDTGAGMNMGIGLGGLALLATGGALMWRQRRNVQSVIG